MACSAIDLRLEELCRTVRKLEKNSKEPSQIIIKVGEERYLIGDLRKRRGDYRIEITDRKTAGANGNKIERKYTSFDALEKTVNSTISEAFIRGQRKSTDIPIHLTGNPETGYAVGVEAEYKGLGGVTYKIVGKVIYPLLGKNEKVSVEKI